MSHIERLPVPHLPGGRVQRAIPAPFTRPSIDLTPGAASPRRDWRTVPVTRIAVGDVVPGVGLVTAITEEIHVPDHTAHPSRQEFLAAVRWDIVLHNNAVGGQRTVPGHETVWAFTAAPTR